LLQYLTAVFTDDDYQKYWTVVIQHTLLNYL
jgi:hypothetical protein